MIEKYGNFQDEERLGCEYCDECLSNDGFVNVDGYAFKKANYCPVCGKKLIKELDIKLK